MAKVGRLAGAILVETEGRFFLVGNTKEPCAYGEWGFEHPGELEPLKRPVVELKEKAAGAVKSPFPFKGTVFSVAGEGEAVAARMGKRFMIERNGSISERLWGLVEEECGGSRGPEPILAPWLGQVPDGIWQIVRDALLRCV